MLWPRRTTSILLIAVSYFHIHSFMDRQISSLSKREVYVLEDTIQMPANETLHIQNSRGSVSVTSKDIRHPHIEVHIYAPTGYAEYVTLQQYQEEQQRTITTELENLPEQKHKHDKRKPTSIAAFTHDYYVTVPHRQSISITSSASTEAHVDSIGGHVGIQGAHIPCHLQKIGGSVSVDIQQGDIVLDNARHYVDLYTASGGITLSHVQGDVTARASRGVHVYDVRGNAFLRSYRANVEMHQVNGLINAQSRTHLHLTQPFLAPETSIFLDSEQNVDLALPRNVDAQFYAKSSRGIVTSDTPITLEPITTRLSRETWKQMQKHVKGTLKAGGPPITVNATGHIHVRQYMT